MKKILATIFCAVILLSSVSLSGCDLLDELIYTNEDEIGLHSLYILKESSGEMELPYWGDGLWKDGIYVASPYFGDGLWTQGINIDI